jgi:AraC-like DNA-binding protein
MNDLNLSFKLPIVANNAGFFISRGKGEHPDRVIDTYELMFVTKGKLSIIEGNRHFDVHEGESLMLWPHRRHKAAHPFEPELRFYWLHFSLLESEGSDDLIIPQQVKIQRPDHLTSLFRRFLDDQEGHTLSKVSANLLVMLMLAEVAGSSQVESNMDESESVLASQVNMIIRTHFHERLNTSVIAEMLHRNPDYLGRVFRDIYGLTITDAINHQRLRQARRLLLESQDKVEEVAVSCGYNDAGYFRRLFKRSEGISPKRFKSLHAKLHVNTQ